MSRSAMTVGPTAASAPAFTVAETIYAEVEGSCRVNLSEEDRRELSRLIKNASKPDI